MTKKFINLSLLAMFSFCTIGAIETEAPTPANETTEQESTTVNAVNIDLQKVALASAVLGLTCVAIYTYTKLAAAQNDLAAAQADLAAKNAHLENPLSAAIAFGTSCLVNCVNSATAAANSAKNSTEETLKKTYIGIAPNQINATDIPQALQNQATIAANAAESAYNAATAAVANAYNAPDEVCSAYVTTGTNAIVYCATATQEALAAALTKAQAQIANIAEKYPVSDSANVL